MNEPKSSNFNSELLVCNPKVCDVCDRAHNSRQSKRLLTQEESRKAHPVKLLRASMKAGPFLPLLNIPSLPPTKGESHEKEKLFGLSDMVFQKHFPWGDINKRAPF